MNLERIKGRNDKVLLYGHAQEGKMEQAKFDRDNVWKNVDEGLNLGGHCQNELPYHEKCGAYVVVRMRTQAH